MACFKPLSAFQLDSGEVVFVERPGVARPLSLPCGQCVGCRLERSRQWAIRCLHESQCHEHSVFVTLTYDDAHLVSNSLNYRDFQLFMKRLRKELVTPIRFYMCGEYGEDFNRPHFHACLFGCFFEDRELYRVLPSGSKLYTSKILSKLWPHGYSSIGDVTFESAAYVARYIMKKITGNNAINHYGDGINYRTGEICERVPEFNKMSLKPGIGAPWFDKFWKEVYPRDEVVVNGRKMKPPKYYDELLRRRYDLTEDGLPYCRLISEEISFDLYPIELLRNPYKIMSDTVDERRVDKARAVEYDNTPERLAVREVVTKARISTKLRILQ